ncbi:MAG: GFA family protein [Magnetovibrio sp.]|nr:GFA family protein [Magnetovibrio sp.]
MASKVGRCHCGAVHFEVELDEGLKALRRCDCSFCRRRWAVMACVPAEDLRVLKGTDVLTLYQWGTRVAEHFFCSVCGIYTHHRRRSEPSQFGINIACFDDVDVRDYMDVPYGGAASSPSDAEPGWRGHR